MIQAVLAGFLSCAVVSKWAGWLPHSPSGVLIGAEEPALRESARECESTEQEVWKLEGPGGVFTITAQIADQI